MSRKRARELQTLEVSILLQHPQPRAPVPSIPSSCTRTKGTERVLREPESFKGALRFLEQDAWKRPRDAAWFLKGGRKEEEEEGDGFVFHNILDIRCPWRAGPTYSVFFGGVFLVCVPSSEIVLVNCAGALARCSALKCFVSNPKGLLSPPCCATMSATFQSLFIGK